MNRDGLRLMATVIIGLAVVAGLGCSGNYGSKGTPAAAPQAAQTRTIQEADAPQSTQGAESAAGYSMKKAGDITLWWQVDGKMLHVKVSAPTTGWVAVGFDPKSHMEGANLILGYVKDGQVHIEDDYGVAQYAHASDVSLGGRDNVTDAAGTESGGVTQISFTVPLDSGDSKDRPLVPGQTCKIILAHGADGVDDFVTHHAEHKGTSITL